MMLPTVVEVADTVCDATTSVERDGVLILDVCLHEMF